MLMLPLIANDGDEDDDGVAVVDVTVAIVGVFDINQSSDNSFSTFKTKLHWMIRFNEQ